MLLELAAACDMLFVSTNHLLTSSFVLVASAEGNLKWLLKFVGGRDAVDSSSY